MCYQEKQVHRPVSSVAGSSDVDYHVHDVTTPQDYSDDIITLQAYAVGLHDVITI